MPGWSVSIMAWTDYLTSNYWKNYGQFSNPITTWNTSKIISCQLNSQWWGTQSSAMLNKEWCEFRSMQHRNPPSHHCCKSCSTKCKCPWRSFSTCNSCHLWEKINKKSAQCHQSWWWKQVNWVQPSMWFFVACWLATKTEIVHSPAKK